MSNQKTTQLRNLLSDQIQPGDLFPIVDVSEITSPTGETKHVTAYDFAAYISSGGFVNLAVPYRGLQYSNGLAFDESISPGSNNQRCYGTVAPIGNQFSLLVNAYVSSDITTSSNARVLFGVGTTTTPATNTPNSAVIGIQNNDLYAYVEDNAGLYSYVVAANFFVNYTEREFVAGLTKDSSGLLTLYINGMAFASSSGTSPGAVSSSLVVMGNGCVADSNVKCTIYDAQIYNKNLSSDTIRNLFYRGVDTTDKSLIASYSSVNLNSGPTQWLDSVGSQHILIPITGSCATNPTKRFILSFLNNGTSSYLGDGSTRNVLPQKYVITSCVVESLGKPLLSIGSSATAAPVSASGTASWNNNRVALVSASYGVNPVNVLALGVAHLDRSIYVYYSASAAPCTFSFDGYIRN